MELKCWICAGLPGAVFAFNRTIMELKLTLPNATGTVALTFNRTIMELKFDLILSNTASCELLIVP